VIGVSRDISERKQAEEKLRQSLDLAERSRRAMLSVLEDQRQTEAALRESETRFRTIFENAAGGVSIVGLDLHLLSANEAYLRMLEYSLDELATCTVFDYTFPEDVTSGQEMTRRVLRGEINSFQQEKRYSTKSGRVVWCLLNVALVRGVNGEPLYFISQVQDVTERKKAEEEIRALNETLEQRVADRTANLEAANRELEAFSYSISHDLRAPLRAIDGFMMILEEEHSAQLDAEGHKVASIVRENAKRMGRQIDELLELSRVSRRELQKTAVGMRGLAQSVFLELVTPHEQDRIRLVLEDIPDIEGDLTCLHQVWTNLLSNAIKFSAKREDSLVEVRARRADGEVVYSVRDNGVGFDMKYSGKLFGVFQRLHAQKDFEGTGVGLAIVQRLIQRHGGRVWAEAQIGEGATFFFALPTNSG
jgi:PAS domain S-box-containing protein